MKKKDTLLAAATILVSIGSIAGAVYAICVLGPLIFADRSLLKTAGIAAAVSAAAFILISITARLARK